MSEHQKFELLCTLAVIGQIRDADLRELKRHIGECIECQHRISDFAQISAQALPMLEDACGKPRSPRGMATRFVERAQAEGIPLQRLGQLFPSRLSFGWQGWNRALAAALLLLVTITASISHSFHLRARSVTRGRTVEFRLPDKQSTQTKVIEQRSESQNAALPHVPARMQLSSERSGSTRTERRLNLGRRDRSQNLRPIPSDVQSSGNHYNPRMPFTGEIFSSDVQKRPPEVFREYGNSARPLLTAQLRGPSTQHSPLVVFAAAVAKNPDSPAPAETLARPYADFGFDVLRDLSAEHPSENIFVSPYSIAASLAMLANGANGTTRQAILETIHSEGQSQTALNTANRTLIEQINKTTAVQLATANGLFVDNSSEVNPVFAQTLHSAYGADAENADFRSRAAAQRINAWVAEHTNDRIQKILDQISPLTVMILADAIAFKGKWSIPFEAQLTEPHDFNGSRGVRKVPMMSHSARYSYTNQNSLEAIRLLYADGTFAMYVVLPKDEAAMRSFLQQLTAEQFSTFVSSLEFRAGTIDLPRFSITYRETLNKTLAKLGMGVAFENSADFQGIAQRPAQLRISEIRHASFLKVDEEGTEAAAATTTGIVAAAVRQVTQPFHMVVDHPFFVAIRDERSGQILFMGVIEQPEG